MGTYRLLVAYDGSGFHGYASQRDVRTVQGTLEAALGPVTGMVETSVAGRTDAGVHATGQVVSFATDRDVDPAVVQRAVNARIGPEIAVLAAERADDEFHARFSATGRQYRYVVLNREAPDPFLAQTAWHVGTALDLDAMNAAVAPLVGEHDFASFCRKAEGRSTVRAVRWAWWRRHADRVELSVAATSFCHQMVRSIVAVAVDAGRGRLDPEDVPEILAARDRSAVRGAAPPHGLTLVAVAYPGSPLVRPDWVAATS